VLTHLLIYHRCRVDLCLRDHVVVESLIWKAGQPSVMGLSLVLHASRSTVLADGRGRRALPESLSAVQSKQTENPGMNCFWRVWPSERLHNATTHTGLDTVWGERLYTSACPSATSRLERV
jgi:hypothetical protein